MALCNTGQKRHETGPTTLWLRWLRAVISTKFTSI